MFPLDKPIDWAIENIDKILLTLLFMFVGVSSSILTTSCAGDPPVAQQTVFDFMDQLAEQGENEKLQNIAYHAQSKLPPELQGSTGVPAADNGSMLDKLKAMSETERASLFAKASQAFDPDKGFKNYFTRGTVLVMDRECVDGETRDVELYIESVGINRMVITCPPLQSDSPSQEENGQSDTPSETTTQETSTESQ